MRERLFSAVRTLIEAASARQPLVFAVEDIHWADEGMLDLIEYLARWARGPALMVCMARDELLDRRPGWGGGRLNATTLTLDPLGARAGAGAGRRAARRAGERGGRARRPRSRARSGGNPLFAEEMVNRILEEGAGEAEALPETVHSVLAARLDSLPRAERRVLQAASVVGQTFWEGSVRDAAEPGLDLRATLESLRGKDLVVPTAGSRLAGEREYAFKHVLIRDVAYSTLPKAVRARKHAEVGEFISARAADRSEGVIAMVAEHYSRAAALGVGRRPRARRAGGDRRPGAGGARGGRRRGRGAVLEQRGAGPLRGGAGTRAETSTRATSRRIGEKLGDVALRLGRVDRAVRAWERCMEYHRGEEDLAPGRRPAPQDRRRALAEGRPRGLDRALPARHRPAQGRPAVHRAGPPLRGGGIALHAHRRQHARDLRLGEGAAARRAARRGGGGEPRARDLRPRLRPDRRLRARPGEPRALGRARPRVRSRRGGARAARARLSPRGLRGRLRAAREAYGEALALALETGDLPSQVELHAALAQLAVYRGDWDEADAGDRRLSRARRARGPRRASSASPTRCAACCAGARATSTAPSSCSSARSRSPSRSAARRSRSRRCSWLAAALRDRGDHADADQALARALDLCERAGLIAQSVEATAARAVNLALWGKAETAREVAEEAAGLAERLRYPVGRAASLEARGATSADPAERARLLAEAREALGGARPPGRRRVHRTPRGPGLARPPWPRPAPRPRTPAGSPRTGACGPARRGGSRSPCPGSPGRSRRSPR